MEVSDQFYAMVVMPTREVDRTLVGPQSWFGRGVEEINPSLVGNRKRDFSALRLSVI
jgi:hypothetical protein